MTSNANTEELALEELKQQIAALKAERDKLPADLDAATRQLTSAKTQAKLDTQRIDRLKLQVKRLAYLLYGRSSEKLTPEETAQLLLSFGGKEEQAQSSDPQVPTPAPVTEELDAEGSGDELRPQSKKRKHPGRTKLSPLLERKVTDVPVPEAERNSKCCGIPMTPISPQEHERVEHIPEQLIVCVERREVLVCKNSGCRADAVTAPRKPTPYIIRRAGVSLLAGLIENKCDDALPIHRQRDRMQRLGFDVPLNTLYHYWAQATDLLSPVAKTTLSCVLGGDYVNVDDTTLKVLDNNDRRGRYQGHLWCFVGTRNLVGLHLHQDLGGHRHRAVHRRDRRLRPVRRLRWLQQAGVCGRHAACASCSPGSPPRVHDARSASISRCAQARGPARRRAHRIHQRTLQCRGRGARAQARRSGTARTAYRTVSAVADKAG